MKKLIFLFLGLPLFSIAQDKLLLVEGVSPKLFIKHKVAPKENYYSIGRIYNVSPKDIAPFNNLQLESGLSLDQEIKIPLNNTNFFQGGNAEPDETFVPVYHLVKEKEGLYRVALNHNELPLETLKQWNNIKGDAVKNGTRLIVGYLKVKKELSSLAKKGIGNAINAKAVAMVEEKKTPESKTPIKIPAADPLPPVFVKETQPEKPQPVKAKPVEAVKRQPSKTENVSDAPVTATGGVFKNQYEAQVRNAETVSTEGTASIFKSTSGWNDKKYYCLHNEATTGTIIKISNPANGKFVFAKVLDLVPDIRQNEGVMLIVSSAAAQELEVSGNFNCSIKYSK